MHETKAGLSPEELLFLDTIDLQEVELCKGLDNHTRGCYIRGIPDGRRVVLEADDGVVGVGRQCGLHHLHQRLRRGLPIQHQLRSEEPMPTACMVTDTRYQQGSNLFHHNSFPSLAPAVL